MPTHNPRNERIKRDYFAFLKDAKGQSEDSVDAAAAALAQFEADTKYRDFKAFHVQQAIAFKRHLADRTSKCSTRKLSKATQHATLGALKRFFQWLSMQPGHKSRVKYTDADYFNLSDKGARIATARRTRPVPTLEQIKHTLSVMPTATEFDRRDRALLAFALLTGARDAALASVKLKHVDLVAGCFHQDAREVATKFSKTFTTYFFPVGDDTQQIVAEWVTYLRARLWGNDDPLFPKTEIGNGRSRCFEPIGLMREHWSNASPIRAAFRQAFEHAGLSYFNPHSIRSTLVQLGQQRCKTPEQFKAWSQNLGHDQVLTTLTSYGTVSADRQGEIIKGLIAARDSDVADDEQVVKSVLQAMRSLGTLKA